MNAPLPFADLTLAPRPEARFEARLAALPMYDLPELTEANDELWAAIGRRLRRRIWMIRKSLSARRIAPPHHHC